MAITLATGVAQGAEGDGWFTQGNKGKKGDTKASIKADKKLEEVKKSNPMNNFVPGGMPATKENKKSVASHQLKMKEATQEQTQAKEKLQAYAGSNKLDMQKKIRLSLQENKINIAKIEQGGHIHGTTNRDINKSYFVNGDNFVTRTGLAVHLLGILNNSEISEPKTTTTAHNSDEIKEVILTPIDGQVTGKDDAKSEDCHKVTILWKATGVWNAYPSK